MPLHISAVQQALREDELDGWLYYETHDERRHIPGTGFTIEPGIYPGIYNEAFGVRTEINRFVGQRDAEVTGPTQSEIVLLAYDR